MEIKESRERLKLYELGTIRVERVFEVTRKPGAEMHRVVIEVGHDGAPNHERCDCRGFKFRRDCAHIKAIFDAGLLSVNLDNTFEYMV